MVRCPFWLKVFSDPEPPPCLFLFLPPTLHGSFRGTSLPPAPFARGGLSGPGSPLPRLVGSRGAPPPPGVPPVACSGALPPGVPLLGAVRPPPGSGGGPFRRVSGSGPFLSPAGPFWPAVLFRGPPDLRVYLYRVLPCGGTCLSLGICWPLLPPVFLASPTPVTGGGTITPFGRCGASPSRGLSRSLPPLWEVTLSLHAGATLAAPGYRPAAPWSPSSARGLSPPEVA